MSQPEQITEAEGHAVRSGVSITTNSKGMAQVKVSVYSGESEEEMNRIKDLAVNAYMKTVAMLGASARF